MFSKLHSCVKVHWLLNLFLCFRLSKDQRSILKDNRLTSKQKMYVLLMYSLLQVCVCISNLKFSLSKSDSTQYINTPLVLPSWSTGLDAGLTDILKSLMYKAMFWAGQVDFANVWVLLPCMWLQWNLWIFCVLLCTFNEHNRVSVIIRVLMPTIWIGGCTFAIDHH